MNALTKGIMVLTISLMPLSLAACIAQPVPVEDAQAAYCEDLDAYNAAVDAVHNLPEGATVEEFEAAIDTVNDAYEELENSAWELADAQTASLEASQDVFRESLDAINGGTTLGEARTIITDAADAYRAAFDEVRSASCDAQ